MGQIKFTKQMTSAEFDALFPDEQACKVYLMRRRWPDGVVKCPRCGSSNHVFALRTMAFKWECMDCGKSTILSLLGDRWNSVPEH